MEVHFTPEQEAQLSEIAAHNGTNSQQLVKDLALRLIDDEEDFRAGVHRGLAAAQHGEFVEHAEVWTNIEKILQS